MGGGRKQNVVTPTDTDNPSVWGGSPLFLSSFMDERYRLALDPKDGVSMKARAMLQRGTCVNTRGIPLFYCRPRGSHCCKRCSPDHSQRHRQHQQ